MSEDEIRIRARNNKLESILSQDGVDLTPIKSSKSSKVSRDTRDFRGSVKKTDNKAADKTRAANSVFSGPEQQITGRKKLKLKKVDFNGSKTIDVKE